MQIHCFIEKNVMDSLFEDDDTCNKTKEVNMLGILKHALAATEDLDVFETLFLISYLKLVKLELMCLKFHLDTLQVVSDHGPLHLLK